MSNQTSAEIEPPGNRKSPNGRSVFVVGVIVGLLINIGFAIAAMAQVFPLPVSSSAALLAPLLPGFAFFIAAFFAAGILIGGPFLLFSRAQRPSAIGALLAAAVFFLSAYLLTTIVPIIRSNAFQRLAARSGELVAAIHRYYDEQGQPPATLDQLVPKYIATIPETRMSAYPDYSYASPPWQPDAKNCPWALWVDIPVGFMDYDEFIYFPNQRYSGEGVVGSYRQFGDWAYWYD